MCCKCVFSSVSCAHASHSHLQNHVRSYSQSHSHTHTLSHPHSLVGCSPVYRLLLLVTQPPVHHLATHSLHSWQNIHDNLSSTLLQRQVGSRLAHQPTYELGNRTAALGRMVECHAAWDSLLPRDLKWWGEERERERVSVWVCVYQRLCLGNVSVDIVFPVAPSFVDDFLWMGLQNVHNNPWTHCSACLLVPACTDVVQQLIKLSLPSGFFICLIESRDTEIQAKV